MPQTVNKANKFYDINKAEPLVTVQKTFGKTYGENPDDDWEETLYVKKNGEYFIYGRGGKNSPYSASRNDNSIAGDRYEIWTDSNYNKARNWVHTNCPDKMDEIFNKDDDNKLVMASIYLSKKSRQNIKRKASEEEITQSELIRRWADSLYP